MMELSQGKLFTFNASSFALDPSVESLLRSKGAVSLDFGAAVYINSEAMPAVLLELIERIGKDSSSNADLIAQLKAENAYLQAALKNVSAAQTSSVQSDVKLKQSYEKIQKEFQALRTQNAEALTSLKVLEDENEELRQELDQLRKHAKNLAAPKTG